MALTTRVSALTQQLALTATSDVLKIPELRIMILSHLPAHSLLTALRVSSQWKATIQKTSQLRRLLFISPPRQKTPRKFHVTNPLLLKYLRSFGPCRSMSSWDQIVYLPSLTWETGPDPGFPIPTLRLPPQTLLDIEKRKEMSLWKMYLSQPPRDWEVRIEWTLEGKYAYEGTHTVSFSVRARTAGEVVRKVVARAESSIVAFETVLRRRRAALERRS